MMMYPERYASGVFESAFSAAVAQRRRADEQPAHQGKALVEKHQARRRIGHSNTKDAHQRTQSQHRAEIARDHQPVEKSEQCACKQSH